jgi:hypothetical protein
LGPVIGALVFTLFSTPLIVFFGTTRLGFREALAVGPVLFVTALIGAFEEKGEDRRRKGLAQFNVAMDLFVLWIMALVPIGIWIEPSGLFLREIAVGRGAVFLTVGGALVVARLGFSAIQTSFRQLTPFALFVLVLRLAEIIVMFAGIYFITGITGPGGRAETFGPCLYFSVITLTTVGYGDWIPLPQSRAFAAAEALIGYVYMALFIAALTTYMNRKPAEER